MDEKFLAKAKRSGIKDVFLGKVLTYQSPLKCLMRRIIDLNEMAFTEPGMSIDVSSSNGKKHLELSKAAK
jgi:hypothetical protein